MRLKLSKHTSIGNFQDVAEEVDEAAELGQEILDRGRDRRSMETKITTRASNTIKHTGTQIQKIDKTHLTTMAEPLDATYVVAPGTGLGHVQTINKNHHLHGLLKAQSQFRNAISVSW